MAVSIVSRGSTRTSLRRWGSLDELRQRSADRLLHWFRLWCLFLMEYVLKKREKTSYIVVHCSATRPKMDWGFAEIDREHKRNGWEMCGYHVIIRRDGTREIGRQIDMIGSHVKGYNHNSVGVCLIGGVNDRLEPENNFTPEQMGALWQVLQMLSAQFPKAEVVGHRDLNAGKACPSFDVKNWYANKLNEGD